MKAIWKDVEAEFEVIEKDGESITLAVPVTGVIDGKKYQWIEKQELDTADEYEITDNSEIIKYKITN